MIKLNIMASHLKGVKKFIMIDGMRNALCEYNIENPTLHSKKLKQ